MPSDHPDFGGPIAGDRPIAHQTATSAFMDRHAIGSYDERCADDRRLRMVGTAEKNEILSQTYEQNRRPSRGVTFPRWCAGAQMNIVDNLLDDMQRTKSIRASRSI